MQICEGVFSPVRLQKVLEADALKFQTTCYDMQPSTIQPEELKLSSKPNRGQINDSE